MVIFQFATSVYQRVTPQNRKVGILITILETQTFGIFFWVAGDIG
jgi:hypothetical protein